MGYSVPAAVAAKLTVPDHVVVSVAEDGCFLMTALEIATAKTPVQTLTDVRAQGKSAKTCPPNNNIPAIADQDTGNTMM